MKGTTLRRIPRLIVSVCVVLAACGSSPPTRFFTLNALAGSAPASLAPGETPAPVLLEPVVIPAELDRLEIVTHLGPNAVRIAATERWAAPLDELIRRALTDDLGTRLPPRAVADPAEPATPAPRRLLSLQVDAFRVDERCGVDLRVHWTLRDRAPPGPGTPTPDERGSEEVDLPAAGDCRTREAAVMSRALATLADRLALVLAGTGPARGESAKPSS